MLGSGQPTKVPGSLVPRGSTGAQNCLSKEPPVPHSCGAEKAKYMAASLLDRLRRETQESHRDVERHLDVVNSVRTAGGYRTLLEQLYGVYCPVESELSRSMSEIATWLPDIDKRMRTASLSLDLRVLGNVCPEALPLAPTPPLCSLPQRFGCLYVLEGSTLGGQTIAREVNSQLRYGAENGCSFFAGHGAETGGMWRRFREALESYAAAHSESHDTIIQSADATFHTFSGWFEGKS
jgi:heme oxygenase (biliverdin-IX-beta and delta-forming)